MTRLCDMAAAAARVAIKMLPKAQRRAHGACVVYMRATRTAPLQRECAMRYAPGRSALQRGARARGDAARRQRCAVQRREDDAKAYMIATCSFHKNYAYRHELLPPPACLPAYLPCLFLCACALARSSSSAVPPSSAQPRRRKSYARALLLRGRAQRTGPPAAARYDASPAAAEDLPPIVPRGRANMICRGRHEESHEAYRLLRCAFVEVVATAHCLILH